MAFDKGQQGGALGSLRVRLSSITRAPCRKVMGVPGPSYLALPVNSLEVNNIHVAIIRSWHAVRLAVSPENRPFRDGHHIGLASRTVHVGLG